MQQCHMINRRKILSLTGNGSLLTSSYCLCIPAQKCTLRGKWSENSQWIRDLIITDILSLCLKTAWNFWTKPEQRNGSIPEPSTTSMGLLPFTSLASLRCSFGCLTKPMIFFSLSYKHRNWWYTWNLELANTSSVWFCCAFSISICPNVIWLQKCSWKGENVLVEENKNS